MRERERESHVEVRVAKREVDELPTSHYLEHGAAKRQVEEQAVFRQHGHHGHHVERVGEPLLVVQVRGPRQDGQLRVEPPQRHDALVRNVPVRDARHHLPKANTQEKRGEGGKREKGLTVVAMRNLFDA